MLLVDLSQVLVSSLMVQLKTKPVIQYNNEPINKVSPDLIRHLTLNSLRTIVMRFKHDYPEVIVCCDNIKSWRRDVFPFYKANRKKNRNKSLLNWKEIFQIFEGIKAELREYLPYKVLEVERAEADDIIAHMTLYRPFVVPVMIVSGDQDFLQLQKTPNVKQYSPVQKIFINCKNPQAFLKEHIICGDTGDGVPNILSQDDSLVIGKRQGSVTKKKLNIWMNQTPQDLCDSEEMKSYYARNELLIDFAKIPKDINDKIKEAYLMANKGTKATLLNYFIKYKLTALLQNLGDY